MVAYRERTYHLTEQNVLFLNILEFNLKMGKSDIVNFCVSTTTTLFRMICEKENCTNREAMEILIEEMKGQSRADIITQLLKNTPTMNAGIDEAIGMEP